MRRLWPKPCVLEASRALALLTVALTFSPDAAQPNGASEDELYIRIVDVGNGLCTITLVPDGHVMIYDTGRGNRCHEAVGQLLPAGADIDLLVLSHPDTDHIDSTPEILEDYRAKVILRTGYVRQDIDAWRNANEAIAREVANGGSVINLQTMPLAPGTQFPLGSAMVTFVVGWHHWEGSGPDEAERRNVISIVLRLEFQGRSVLFTGDTVGRRRDDDNSACKDAEKAMVENVAAVPIRSDVMTAPHHGGNNGSSNCFIRAVNPQYVIFPAGRGQQHPTQAAADRYIANGVPSGSLFRTDRGDHEGGKEWIHGALAGCLDKPGDDDVEITISSNRRIQVEYRTRTDGC